MSVSDALLVLENFRKSLIFNGYLRLSHSPFSLTKSQQHVNVPKDFQDRNTEKLFTQNIGSNNRLDANKEKLFSYITENIELTSSRHLPAQS